MNINKMVSLLTIATSIILVVAFYLNTEYRHSVITIFSIIVLLSIANSIITARYNNISGKVKAVRVWLYCLLIMTISLAITFVLYILRSGSFIKYGDDIALMFMIISFIAELIVVTIAYWLSYFICKKVRC